MAATVQSGNHLRQELLGNQRFARTDHEVHLEQRQNESDSVMSREANKAAHVASALTEEHNDRTEEADARNNKRKYQVISNECCHTILFVILAINLAVLVTAIILLTRVPPPI